MKRIFEKMRYSEFWKRNKACQSFFYRSFSKVYNRSRGFFRKARREYCYMKYSLGAKNVRLKFGDITARYETNSPKDYWLLSIGIWELSFMKDVIFEYVRPEDVCLDIGAHVGMYTIPIALRVGSKGRVIAFEPNEQNFNSLLRNISFNKLDNIHSLRMAVSNEDGEIPFYCRPNTDQHSIYPDIPWSSPNGQYTVLVKSARIDTLVSNGTIPKPNFIKIDIEGGELEAIRGLGEAGKHARAMLVEIHEKRLILAGHDDPFDEVVNSLKNLGFSKFKRLDWKHVLAYR